jgi:nucleoside-diphosphate-sugar epimerase
MAAAGFEDTSDGEIVNLGPFKPVTLNRLAKVILREFGAEDNKELQPKYEPSRPREVKFAYSTEDKARELLGFQRTTSLEDGIRQFIAWARETYPNGVKPDYKDRLELESENLPRTWKEKLY